MFVNISKFHKSEKTKTGPNVHVRMQVRVSRAFQDNNFPLARRNYHFSNNTKRKWPSQDAGVRGILGMETSACTRCLQTSSFEDVRSA